MKMLLVDPFTTVNANVPNLGLAYAASHYKATVIDLHILPYPKNRFLKYNADILAISVKSFSNKEACRIKSVYKSKFPLSEVKSVSGFLDVQCCYPYVKWERDLSFKEPFSDRYPFPKYELFDSFNYLQTNWETGFWSYPLITSLGCPYQCSFCAARNRKWHARSPENCLEELKQAKEKYKIKSFEILDDAFNIDTARVIKFCHLIKPLNLSWACTNGVRADRFNEDTALAMKESGCNHIGFGIESTSANVLAEINKGENFDTIVKAVDTARQYFDMVSGFFIIGLPGSSFEKDMASIEWAKKNKIRAHFSCYVPDMLEENGNTFYGAGSVQKSPAYSKELQKKVYAASRELKRSYYIKEKLLFRIILYTLKGLFKYDFYSKINHLCNLLKKGFLLATKSEIS